MPFSSGGVSDVFILSDNYTYFTGRGRTGVLIGWGRCRPRLDFYFHFQGGITSQGLGQTAPGEPIPGGRVTFQVGIPEIRWWPGG